MPWQEKGVTKLRMEFLVDYESELYNFSELCEYYGISRVTGYKLLHRYEENGIDGLKDRSRAPKNCPHRLPEEVAELLIAARRQHPTWGPKKLLPWLARRHSGVSWPSPSTVSELLRREGLAEKRRRRRKLEHPGKPVIEASTPNQLWAADFKGQFLTRDGNYCYPLTVSDQYSRFLLGCKGLDSVKEVGAKRVFERLFREYGLPGAIRTDNGAPFATIALGRLSKLAVWWIKMGIRPELIEPSHPEQNGRHERMHRTLKAETTRPAAANLKAQQREFDSGGSMKSDPMRHSARRLPRAFT